MEPKLVKKSQSNSFDIQENPNSIIFIRFWLFIVYFVVVKMRKNCLRSYIRSQKNFKIIPDYLAFSFILMVELLFYQLSRVPLNPLFGI